MNVYWLLPITIVPPTMAVAGLAPAVITVVATRFAGSTVRWIGVVAGLPLIVLGIGLLFTRFFAEPADFEYLIHLLTGSGFLLTGIVLPWLAWGAYLVRSAKPRWWAASSISLGTFVLGSMLAGVIGPALARLGA